MQVVACRSSRVRNTTLSACRPRVIVFVHQEDTLRDEGNAQPSFSLFDRDDHGRRHFRLMNTWTSTRGCRMQLKEGFSKLYRSPYESKE